MRPDESARLCSDIEEDPDRADLSACDRAILRYADKLTRSPSRMVRADVDALRRRGITDRGIHDICSCAAYFNYVNRLADGLGVELEDGMWGPDDWYPRFSPAHSIAED